jgi:uncharacterized pyridoxamine 5'-phosphate oxidase family protein
VVEREPVTTLSPGFSGEGAVATTWAEGRNVLENAEAYWVTTVRPDGRPHVTTLLAVWHDGALYFCTGDGERKAKNLAQNRHCILTTGCNTLEGLDVVVEGEAQKVSAEAELRDVADVYEAKYGARFTAPDGTWFGLADAIRDGNVPLYRVAPSIAYGFGKGAMFSQTQWSFG